MAALDIDVAPALRELLRRVLAERTTILVTHDVLDVVTLADRVAVLEDGTTDRERADGGGARPTRRSSSRRAWPG